MKTRSLKWRTAFLSLALLLHAANSLAIDVYVDPTTTAAVISAKSAIEEVHKEQNKKLTAIETMNLAISAQLQVLHTLEDSIFSYLRNAQQFVWNLYDVKKCVELAAIDIPESISGAVNAIPGHLEGTLVTALVSRNATEAALEITNLISFLNTLAGTGGYVTGVGSDMKLEKVNLLNSSQRYFVIQKVKSTLNSINWRFKMLRTQILFYNWRTLFRQFDPQSWSYYIGAQYIARDVISRIDRII